MLTNQKVLDSIFAEIKAKYKASRILDCLDKNDRLIVECNYGDCRAIGQLAMSFKEVYTYSICDIFRKGRITIFLK